MTKTCPIFSQYNGYWYFYEDIGQLAPKWLSLKEAEKPEEGTPQTVVISEQRKSQAFNDLYLNMNKCLEQAYTASQKIQKFSWYPLEDLSWTSKDEKGNEQSIIMKDMLPSKEALQLLMMQIDRCNAFAVKLWLENPYKKPTDQTGKHLTPAAWYTPSQQLELEIGKAEDQSNNIKLDASKKFDDINWEFIKSVGTVSLSYGMEFQSKRDNYAPLLDEIMKNLEQSRLLALEIRHLEINPYILNAP